MNNMTGLFKHRRAGVLLHPTSLPSPYNCGDLGAEAHHFVDFLADCGFRVWQMLPIGPTHADGSPYQLLSVQAGNPRLVDLEWLQRLQLLQPNEMKLAAAAPPCDKIASLQLASTRFAMLCEAQPASDIVQRYSSFCGEHSGWLDDFALYTVIRAQQQFRAWQHWPMALRMRNPEALVEAASQHSAAIAAVKFVQFAFYEQWQQLRDHAQRRGIALFGDMPIFVHLDSADVWANQHLFRLDAQGQPEVVTGVPPDYFSVDGQRWGNPHYAWEQMEAEGFDWWIERVATQQRLFDLIRVDHFRGFEACWEIPANVATAVDGKWVKAPGESLFAAVGAACGDVPFVAENLGLITAEVEQLRNSFALPGMLILQFAFDGSPDNPYLPHNHRVREVVYTGTHDNDTTRGWYASLDVATRQRIHEYFGQPAEPMPWLLIRAAMASVAGLAIAPMQDLLDLDSEHRMNTPGTTSGNWGWRFRWDGVSADLPRRLRQMLSLYSRLPPG
jgi:4-alpha-glucanotransferase